MLAPAATAPRVNNFEEDVFVPQLRVSRNPTIITEQLLPRQDDPNIFVTPDEEDDLILNRGLRR